MNATDFWTEFNAKWKPILVCAGCCKSVRSKNRYPELMQCECRPVKGEYPPIVEVQQRKVVVGHSCGLPEFGMQYGSMDETVVGSLREVVEASPNSAVP